MVNALAGRVALLVGLSLLCGCVTDEALETRKTALAEANGRYDAALLAADAAVLTGKFVGRTRVAGREFGFSERYSTVWVNERARRRLVLEHGTIVEDGK